MPTPQFDPTFEDAEVTSDFPLDPSKPLVLLLGWVDHEGIISSLKSSGRQYKKKILDSTPENWDSVVAFFTEYKVSSVLVKLSPHVCRLLMHEDYVDARVRLFERIASVPNLIFAYEDILVGEQSDKFREEYKPYPPKEVLDAALDFLRQYRLELAPYKKNAEVTVIAESFLDDTERNLIFRLYVPSGKLWSTEADKFLQLFQDYLSKVDQLAVRLDQKRTDHGIIYEFHGQSPRGEHDLSGEFHDFSKLMDLCASNVEAAATLLSSKSLNAKEVTRIIERYAKEARRLQLDIKHEAESKTVSIRHRLESELIDLAPTAEDWRAITSVIERAIPPFTAHLPEPSQSLNSVNEAQAGPRAHVTYNIRPQFIQTVNGVVAEEVHGSQHFAPEHRQLLELVRTHAPANAKELETAVYEIADNSGKQVDRLKATQKIKAFVIEVGKKTGDVAFSILQKYVEKQLGL
jgi:hypothetical protein